MHYETCIMPRMSSMKRTCVTNATHYKNSRITQVFWECSISPFTYIHEEEPTAQCAAATNCDMMLQWYKKFGRGSKLRCVIKFSKIRPLAVIKRKFTHTFCWGSSCGQSDECAFFRRSNRERLFINDVGFWVLTNKSSRWEMSLTLSLGDMNAPYIVVDHSKPKI